VKVSKSYVIHKLIDKSRKNTAERTSTVLLSTNVHTYIQEDPESLKSKSFVPCVLFLPSARCVDYYIYDDGKNVEIGSVE
jgi:hypothetical protein